MTQASPAALKRTLALWQVSLAGIGVILGAGVYALIGPAAGLAGDALWLAFLAAGTGAGLTAYSYARLGAMQPKASPEFQYVALAFGTRTGFVAGGLMLVADICAASAVALGFGGYASHVTGTPIVLNALALLVVLGAFAYAGVGESVGLALLLTLVEAAGLVFVIVVGAPYVNLAALGVTPDLGGVSAAAALIFFAYLGFDELGNFAEEMHDPARNLPRALGIAMVAATLIYVAVALAATAVVGWRELAATPAPLAVVARRLFGARADTLMTAVALATTANTVLLLLVAAARSIYGMSVAEVLPPALARVGRRGVPTTATAAVLALAAVLSLIGDLTRVAVLTDGAVLTSFLLVNAGMVWLSARRRTPGTRGRQAVDLTVALVATLLCGWFAWHTVQLAALGH